MEMGIYGEDFTLDEFETLEKANKSIFGFLERLFVVLGYRVEIKAGPFDVSGTRRITATYRKIDP